MSVLSRRLRKRLRQIDGAPAQPARPVERAASEPVRVGEPGLSRERLIARVGGSPQPAPREPQSISGPLEELAPGEIVECDCGRFWLVAGPAGEMLPHGAAILDGFKRLLERAPATGRLGQLQGLRPKEVALLDTETAGLSAAPIFLVGMIVWQGNEVEEALCVQMFARDYAEERAVLARAAELLAPRRALMTYNGRSFDLPLMRERMIYHGLGACPEPRIHLDLLHVVRSLFRGVWDNCRLQTLEQRLCGRSRWDDIDGARIPQAWHDFIASEDAAQMADVLDHNRLDLITMLEALPHLQAASDVT